MSRIALLLTAVATLVFSSPVFAAKKLVVLTAFEPFGGSSRNSSLDVARLVQNEKKRLGPDVEVKVCLLPVVFDQAAAAAEKCIQALPKKPDLVISLGEGRCAIRLETVVYNLDAAHGFSDNSGSARKTGMIDRQGALSRGLTLPLDDWLCLADLTKKEQKHTRLSIDPSNYVCNNTAYRLVERLQVQGIPYGFIHVPPQELCETYGLFSDPKQTSQVVGKLIRRGLNAGAHELLRKPALPSEPACQLPQSLPVNAQELNTAAGLLNSSNGLCKKYFYEDLKSTIERESKQILSPETFQRKRSPRWR